VLDACNGRPAHRFSINSSPTESNSYDSALFARFAAYAAGQPLQGECRRFDPVSTHQLDQSLKLFTRHPVRRATLTAGLFSDVGRVGQVPQFRPTVIRRYPHRALARQTLAVLEGHVGGKRRPNVWCRSSHESDCVPWAGRHRSAANTGRLYCLVGGPRASVGSHDFDGVFHPQNSQGGTSSAY
jgi:hypothetical protein